MADNITLPGAASVVATDDVGGVHYQVVKLDLGGNGASAPVSASIPVTASALEALLTTLAGTIAAHNAPFSDGSPGQIMLGKRRDADTTTVADGDLDTLNMDEEGRLKVASKPASYVATTGDVTTSTSTIPINTERFSNLMIHCAGTFAGVNCTFEGSLDSTNGTDGNWFAVQAIRSSANTIETTTGVLGAAPAYAWELSVNALKYFRIRATARTSGTQTWTMVPGTYATEPIPGAQVSGTQPVSGTVTATVTAGTINPVVPATPYFLSNTASTHNTPILIIAGTSNLSSFYATNTNTSPVYVHLFNKATAPAANSDRPEMTIIIPAAPASGMAAANPFIGFHGFRFPLGLGISISSNASYLNVAAVTDDTVQVKLTRTV
jgi:hypothetical protein